jgi:hypothetical protein
MDDVLRPSQLEIIVKIRGEDCRFVIVPDGWLSCLRRTETWEDETTGMAWWLGSSSWTRTGRSESSITRRERDRRCSRVLNVEWVRESWAVTEPSRITGEYLEFLKSGGTAWFPVRHKPTWLRKLAVVRKNQVRTTAVTCSLSLYRPSVSSSHIKIAYDDLWGQKFEAWSLETEKCITTLVFC